MKPMPHFRTRINLISASLILAKNSHSPSIIQAVIIQASAKRRCMASTLRANYGLL
jgi:hypothetical protein